MHTKSKSRSCSPVVDDLIAALAPASAAADGSQGHADAASVIGGAKEVIGVSKEVIGVSKVTQGGACKVGRGRRRKSVGVADGKRNLNIGRGEVSASQPRQTRPRRKAGSLSADTERGNPPLTPPPAVTPSPRAARPKRNVSRSRSLARREASPTVDSEIEAGGTTNRTYGGAVEEPSPPVPGRRPRGQAASSAKCEPCATSTARCERPGAKRKRKHDPALNKSLPEGDILRDMGNDESSPPEGAVDGAVSARELLLTPCNRGRIPRAPSSVPARPGQSRRDFKGQGFLTDRLLRGLGKLNRFTPPESHDGSHMDQSDDSTSDDPGFRNSRERTDSAQSPDSALLPEAALTKCSDTDTSVSPQFDSSVALEHTDESEPQAAARPGSAKPSPVPLTSRSNNTSTASQSSPPKFTACGSDSDDGDLPDAFSDEVDMSLEKGDLAWVKTKGYPFWPALIMRVDVSKRPKKLTLLFIGDNGVKLAKGMNKNTILPFGRDYESQELFKKAGQSCPDARFPDVVNLAEGFLLQKAEDPSLDPFKFFFPEQFGFKTAHVGSGDASSAIVTDSSNVDTAAASYKPDPLPESDGAQAPSGLQDPRAGDSPMSDDEGDTQADTDDVIAAPMSETLKKRIARRKDTAQKLVDYIKTDAIKNVLRDIYEGKTKSWRHDLYKKADRTRAEDRKLQRGSDMGVVEDEDQQSEITRTVAAYYREMRPDCYREGNYILNVWIPEAVIYAIRRVRRVGTEQAEKILEQGARTTKEERKREEKAFLASVRLQKKCETTGVADDLAEDD